MARRGAWPANPIIYQIYPRSFQDSAGTGEGDLPGVIHRLDHVARLGVDAIWLSPFYTSPMCDGGYDVADHTAVDPRFGTLGDFDAVVARAHDLGLRVMVDQVFNHTSVSHPWFRRSRDGDPDYADHYVWADARPDGSPPSNWIGYFGHPAWRWHPQRGQYCLHQFLPCQPCLNHLNPRVRDELAGVCAFWRDRGVDGFRFDAVTSYFFDPRFRDNPPADDGEQALIPGPPSNPFTLQRHDHDMLPDDCAAFSGDLRQWAGEDAYLLGEINQGPRSVELVRAFTQEGRLDAAYTIDLTERGLSGGVLRDVVGRLEGEKGFAWWLSSHDQPRQVSRAGDGSARDARLLAAILLALPGPMILYQGEELGMVQPDLPHDVLRDPFDRLYWPDPPGRDGARTPMLWSDDANAGFSTGTPWLPVTPAPAGSAATQDGREGSVLEFYRTAIALRRASGLDDADIEVMETSEDMIAAVLTCGSGTRIGLAANLGHEPVPAPFTGSRILETAEQGESVAPRSAVWLRL